MMTLLKDVALPTDLGGLVGKAGAVREAGLALCLRVVCMRAHVLQSN